MYRIESNVPVPSNSGNRGRPSKYPFGEMAVGDSFAANLEEKDKIQCAASMYGRRKGMKFSTHKVGNSVRCWRIK